MNPHATYKAFGGIASVLTLPYAVLTLLKATPPGGGPPAPLSTAVLPALLGSISLYVFIASDRKLKALNQGTDRRGADWKGIGIATGAFSLYLLLIILKARHVL